MARSLVWWPGLDKEIAALVASCVICRKTAHRPPQSATSVWPLPTKPWERLHVDYAGPVDGRNFLIMVDAYTKWPMVKVVSDLTASTLITHIRNSFADFGTPDLIVSDNGTQFTSKEFAEFLKMNGVRHLTSPPWHPASNEGDTHARVARCLKAMRTMPHATTNLSAAEALFGRRLPSTLTKLHPSSRTSEKPAPPPLPPGSIKDNEGGRTYVVLLHDGSVLRVSVDEVQRRLEHHSTAPPPPPPEEPQAGPVQKDKETPATSNQSVKDDSSSGVPTGVVVTSQPTQPMLAILPPPAPTGSNQKTSPVNKDSTPGGSNNGRGRGRGLIVREKPKGTRKETFSHVFKEQETRSGRRTKIPQQFADV
ncbi:uncharacterized protein K02A2.6-like [Frankliniella occidentalis]|uniref:Uncharacterized protein K02A2.6-like n=1 Tax=Frankliniella occidentalis TaxID=133901 RepID=A0A9C6U8E5_FRAOC|nr:uncharacterized protein K02A2.6-like [Frankliniella occidentalis]